MDNFDLHAGHRVHPGIQRLAGPGVRVVEGLAVIVPPSVLGLAEFQATAADSVGMKSLEISLARYPQPGFPRENGDDGLPGQISLQFQRIVISKPLLRAV
jgi:hypothetical protein